MIEPVGPAGIAVRRTRFSPRQRQRISRFIQYALFVVVVGVLALIADWDSLAKNFFREEYFRASLPELFTIALRNTVTLTFTGYLIGFFLGLLIALMRLSSVAPYRWFGLVYVEVFRGLPLLVILLILAFGLAIAFPTVALFKNTFATVAIGLGLAAAAYMAESFRAGVQAVPRGQMEAARSLGMSYSRAMISIVLPQAVRIVIPPLTNEFVLLLKDSSLAFAVGATAASTELTKFGSDLATENANSTPLIVVGVTYLMVTVPMSYLARRLEARHGKGR